MTKLNVLPNNPENDSRGRFPSWLHRKLPEGNELFKTNSLIRDKRLYTVCEEAKCPNLLECYSKKTATFLILGKQCTRACGFCEIAHSQTPPPPDPEEPARVAESVVELGLTHVVITMVARDDLPDGGADALVKVVKEVRKKSPHSTIETLTSDFDGNFSSIDKILEEPPEIFNHNIETVPRLSIQVRHKATFERSTAILSYVKSKTKETLVKSGIMLGLGETRHEVVDTLKILRDCGCDIVTIGQYLQASARKLRVKEFIHPDLFAEYAEEGRKLGIQHVYSGPFVRSSYNAKLFVRNVEINST